MRAEPYKNKDGYKIWLNRTEQQRLLDYFEEEPINRLAVRLGLHGLRADEIIKVCKEHIRKLETEDESEKYVLIVPDGKSGFGEVPISSTLKQELFMLTNARGLRQDTPVIDASKRTVQRWVTSAGEYLSTEEPDKKWEHLTCHDLRRTWATELYYSLNGSRAKELVMSFGRWQDESTFRENYLGKPTDSVICEVMEEAAIN